MKQIFVRLVFLIKTGLKIFFYFGPRVFFRKLNHWLLQFIYRKGAKQINEEYKSWTKKYTVTPRQIEKFKQESDKLQYKPHISILLPVYNVEEEWLKLAVESVFNQIYENWELCIVDDASTVSYIKPYLKELEKQDRRIKVKFLEKNENISGASNECLKISTGEFVALMDNDDELAREALYEVAKVLNETPDLDFIYSDEDQITIDGARINPIFKPDWSPETILSYMYINHLSVYRKALVEQVKGFRKGFEGSQDYDLVLRLTEHTSRDRIYHIAKVLYHWRRIPGSTAETPSAKPYAVLAQEKVLKETLQRRGINAELVEGIVSMSFRVKRSIINNPKVSIIIPTKNRADLVKQCIESIEAKTTYKNYELILIDHNSDDLKSLEYFDEVAKKHIVLKYTSPVFNYSALNNFGAKHASGEHLLFLNNDIEVINEEWLTSMLEFSQLDEIGAVGAKLIYPNNTIQHAGIVLQEKNVAEHIHRTCHLWEKGYMDRIQIIQNFSAVTGACMMVKKRLFEEVGGFDEENLAVTFNDIDFCLKLLEAGYRNIYTPFAELYHYESVSRGKEDSPDKIIRYNKERYFVENKWRKYIESDPYFNQNLRLDNGTCSLKF